MLLALGGLLGTAGRYALVSATQRWLGPSFPYGTLAVNGIGCLAIGFLSGVAERRAFLTPDARLFWMVGLLGAFTTFSAFIYESWGLWQAGQRFLALVNLQGSLLVGLLMLWIGSKLGALL